MTPRWYQTAAVQAVYDYYANNTGNCLVILPTAAGKSATMGWFMQRAIGDYPQTRIAVVTHVRELIEQSYAALRSIWPDAPAGIYSAGLRRREFGHQISFLGIQSVHRKAHELGHIDLMLIDEVHRVSRKDASMYLSFINNLKRYSPKLKVIGWTATPYRMDSGLLTEGDDALFEAIAFEVGLVRLIEQRFLTKVVSKATKTELDVTGVGTRGGEFIQSQLERAVDKEPVTRMAVEEIVAFGQTRRSWLVFCSGLDHSYHVRDVIREHGFSCETVLGDTPPAARDRIFADFKAGKIRALTGCNVFTTGFDAPCVDLIALLRPTKSVGLYYQMCGRGLRLFPEKQDCLVLDFAGNVKRHGPLDELNGRRNEKGKGEAPVKICPHCASICHASVRTCPDCGFGFPTPELKIQASASTAPILSFTRPVPQDFWVPVQRVAYRRHEKVGKPPSLCVTYSSGLITYKQWVCPEHGAFPQQNFWNWWQQRQGQQPAPVTVAEALRRTGELRVPTSIRIRRNGKYDEVMEARFEAAVAA